MRANLSGILKLSTNNEGGYSNHKADPGGPTNHGITQGTLSAYLKRPASIADVKALTLETANMIYVANYWRPIQGDKLPSGLDYAVFDFGINSGPSRAVKELQKLLPGVAADGVLGQKTLTAIGLEDIPSLIRKYCAARIKFCQGLKNWKSFGRGWTYRVLGTDPENKFKRKPGVVGDSLAIAAKAPVRLAPDVTALPDDVNIAMAKARDEETKILTPTRNKLQIGAITASVGTGVIQFATNYLPTFTQFAGTLEPYKDQFKYVGLAFVAVTVVCAGLTLVLNIDKLREQGSHA